MTWSRMALAGWFWAAALFVVTGVLEVTSGGFESLIKDRLVTVRFPAYYLFGFSLVGSGLLTLLASYGLSRSPEGCKRTGCGCIRWPAFLLVAALILMAVDYVWIYRPLEELVTPPGKPRTQEFISLHHWSMYINSAHVSLAGIAAWLVCWPNRPMVPVQQSPPIKPLGPS